MQEASRFDSRLSFFFRAGTSASASTSAHSGFPCAKLRKACGTAAQQPNRVSSVRGECVPFRRYARREGTARSFRTVSPHPLSSSMSSGRAYSLLGRSPAARTASFHVGKYRKTKYFGIPARATNSDIDGAAESLCHGGNGL